MKQALHIFGKDVRHLWPSILVVLLVAAAQAYYDVLWSPINTVQTARTNTISVLLKVIEVLAWFYLVASVIFEEPLPGDRHFWLTRPYSRWSLVAAKLLFLLVFFNLTLLLSDCCLLWQAQLPIAIPALLLRHLFLTGTIVLPVLTLATLTRGISQLVLAALLLLALVIGELILLSPPGRGMVLSGTSSFVILTPIVSLAVVGWQFATRRTFIAVAVLAICIFGVLPAANALMPAGKVIEFEDYSADVKQQLDPGKLSIAFSTDPSANCYEPPQGPNWVRFAFPVDVAGLPPRVLLLGRSEIHIDKVRSRPGEIRYGFLEKHGQQYCLGVTISQADLDSTQLTGANLSADMWLTAERDDLIVRAPTSQETFRVPGSGYCTNRFTPADPNVGLVCTTGPYNFDRVIVQTQTQGPDGEWPWGAEIPGRGETENGLSPVRRIVLPIAGFSSRDLKPLRSPLQDPGAQIEFYRRRPIGYGRKVLTAAGLDLNAFVSR